MKILKYTSALFLTTVLHAKCVADDSVHFLMLCLLISSIMYHSYEGNKNTYEYYMLFIVDVFFVVLNFLYFTFFSTLFISKLAPLFSLFLFLLYGYGWLNNSNFIHAILHFSAVVGVHAYLFSFL